MHHLFPIATKRYEWMITLNYEFASKPRCLMKGHQISHNMQQSQFTTWKQLSIILIELSRRINWWLVYTICIRKNTELQYVTRADNIYVYRSIGSTVRWRRAPIKHLAWTPLCHCFLSSVIPRAISSLLSICWFEMAFLDPYFCIIWGFLYFKIKLFL